MKKFLNNNIYLIIILIVGAVFRFYGLNWDQNQHLHPDERFLTMVGNAISIPQDISIYLDPGGSTFNPANVGYPFFVYGVLPIVINKILAIGLNTDTYNSFTLQGRFLSALADLLIVLLVYKTVELLEKKYNFASSVRYWASFFYAISVLPIQLSHFFAVDSFLNLFMFASFYFALRFWLKRSMSNLCLSALFFGLALASKVTAIYILPLLLFFIGVVMLKTRNVVFPLLYAAIAYLTVRIADPYLFQNNNFFDPRISTLFLNNLKSLKSFEGSQTTFPPAIQWIHKPPILFSLLNLSFFGLGVPYMIAFFFGGYRTIKNYARTLLCIILLWVVLFFIYQSIQFAKTMRYFIFLYPFLAIFAAIGFYYVTTFARKYFQYWYLLLVLVLIGSILLWPLMFLSIYTKDHPRVAASKWIYENIPQGSTLSCEHWDDCLPLAVDGKSAALYQTETLTLYDPDTMEKWDKIDSQLEKIDYIVLSSNRLWGSIPTVPERYPITTMFYQDLFSQKRGFTKVAEITSYPSLRYLGIPIDFPDDWAEEAFTVYDHPKIIIFREVNTIK